METFIGIVLIVSALFLVVAILLQSSKENGMSNPLGGSSSTDTYLGKNKANSRDYILNKLTIVVAIVFALVVLISFIRQKDDTFKLGYKEWLKGNEDTTTTVTTDSGTSTPDGTTDPNGTTDPSTSANPETTPQE